MRGVRNYSGDWPFSVDGDQGTRCPSCQSDLQPCVSTLYGNIQEDANSSGRVSRKFSPLAFNLGFARLNYIKIIVT